MVLTQLAQASDPNQWPEEGHSEVKTHRWPYRSCTYASVRKTILVCVRVTPHLYLRFGLGCKNKDTETHTQLSLKSNFLCKCAQRTYLFGRLVDVGS